MQVSYGLIGCVGVGINYSKPFVCICKHTRIRFWQGCPAEVGNLKVSVSWPSALHCNTCPTPCSPGNVPTPTPEHLMGITLCQDWSATYGGFGSHLQFDPAVGVDSEGLFPVGSIRGSWHQKNPTALILRFQWSEFSDLAVRSLIERFYSLYQTRRVSRAEPNKKLKKN